MSQEVICIFLENGSMGGAERQALYLARDLSQKDQLVEVWCLDTRKNTTVSSTCKEWGIKYNQLNLWGYKSGELGFIDLYSLILALRQASIKHLIAFTFIPNYLGSLVWRFSGVKKCIWNQRDAGNEIPLNIKAKFSLKLASNYVANSPSAKEFLLKNGVNEKSITLIGNGINLDKSGIAKANLHNKVVMVANFGWEKDHETLIKAWGIVIKSQPNLRLQLAGLEGVRSDQVNALIKKLNLNSSIDILGHVSDIPELLSKSTIGVLCSKQEGCPNAVMEYVKAGLPVVGTDISGIRYVLSEDNNKYLIPVGDFKALAEIILKFYHDRTLSKAINIANYKKLENNFSMEVMVKSYMNLLGLE